MNVEPVNETADEFYLDWRSDGKRHQVLIGQVQREDFSRLFGLEREEQPAQQTINRAVRTGLMALRNAGSTIRMKKGEWPKLPEVATEIHDRDELKEFFDACAPG